jgi:HEPN domain-containing protein
MSASDRLQRATDELTRARRDAAADDTMAVLQHACQSLEAALKAIIAHEGQTVPTGRRSHELRYLQSTANADLSAHTAIIDELAGVYDLARYADTPDPGITEPQRVISEVDTVVTFAQEYLKTDP